jgi:RimJ/RimL family protein N-acetyltransferase
MRLIGKLQSLNMNSYKALNKQVYSDGIYSIVPIRNEDRLHIMNWRNDQIYHLRQQKPLSIKDQNNYFTNVISKLFEKDKPDQILFSFLENGICVGYGGLVHINWIDKNAEVSFIMDTKLENLFFQLYWSIFLESLMKVAFDELGLYKTYVFAFDLRPHLYEVLENSGYFFDARLAGHCLHNGEFKDVVIYSTLNK